MGKRTHRQVIREFPHSNRADVVEHRVRRCPALMSLSSISGPALSPLNRDQFQSGKLRLRFQRREQFMPRRRFQTEEMIQKRRATDVRLSRA